MKEFIKNKLIALLGLKHLYLEMQELRETLEDLELQYDDTKYLAENLESEVSELESRIDEKEYELDNAFVDLENRLETTTEEALDSFNEMTKGYVLDVKLRKE